MGPGRYGKGEGKRGVREEVDDKGRWGEVQEIEVAERGKI